MEQNITAIITGASGGIGSEIAKRLAKLKINLAIVGRNEEKLKTLKTELIKEGIRVEIFSGSLTEEKFLSSLLPNVNDAFGGFDILINSAGVAENKKFEETSLKDFDDIMNINARVPFFLMRESLKYLRNSKTPTIINIASVVGHVGYVNQSAYSASKHALIGLSQSLSREVYKEGIRVHLISPGGVYTDMVKISRPDLTADGMIMPTDIADIVEFILTHRTNAMIDEFNIRRETKEPF